MPSVTSWNRLEPRARSGDMRPGLEARVHDPLWLLARQWQLGEFQGEDAASPAWARLRAESAPLTVIRTPGGAPTPLDAGFPLETTVERMPAGEPDRRTAAEAGLHFLRLLADEGMAAYRDAFVTAFPLAPPTGETDPASRRYLQLMSGRAPDGLELGTNVRGGLPTRVAVDLDDQPEVRAAIRRYLTWLDDLVRTSPHGAWQPERFEYDIEVAAPGGVVLRAPEYAGGALDWHSFVHDTDGDLTARGDPVPIVATVLPSPASYAGMPEARFWKLEDRRIDFGGIEAAPTDLARMLVLDFATVFGNDWFVIPLQLPVGTLTQVRSLVVGDTFGDRWLIGPAARADWSMYLLSAVGSGAKATGGRLDRLLLPSALVTTLEGDPLEQVLLLRDEDANVAWAIEQTVEGAAGVRVDRVEAWQEHRRRYGDAAAHSGAPAQIAPFTYRLVSEVPEHWIPLVPEETAPGRTVLRVSAIQRPGVGGGGPEPVLPRGLLLRSADALRVPEEEVPSEGAQVTRSWHYTRWTDGSAHLWEARRKRAGRGPASSGLAFDLVEPWHAPGRPLAYAPVRLAVTAAALTADPVDLHRLAPGERAVVRWEIRNVGTATWYRVGDDALRLGTSGDRDHPGRLAAASWLDPARPAAPAESVIGPGQVATFVFEIRAPAAPGPFHEVYEPLLGDNGWIGGPQLELRGSVTA
ncbi:hypothetical protein ASF98_21465 [Arthrobacter sp. Leaf337]|uniref:hypothetical protein n=1 Tax=Arthrobacter sp. Leaf337 TaxID=1736342 RepID=UPI0006FE1913|nr:hypothetical protein [Arthrobacter sp. Leaf337]KQR77319.1 hypothetical protein ASF98_21465 [Arthrobacter sp. Leaf337]